MEGHTAACELLITRGGNVNALDTVSDCVMVNGGEKERGARGWGNGWIIVWVIIVLFLYFVFVRCIFCIFLCFKLFFCRTVVCTKVDSLFKKKPDKLVNSGKSQRKLKKIDL